MAISPAIMIGMTVLSTAMSVYGQMQQGRAAKAQAGYQSAVARNNQILAERAAKDAEERGKIAAARRVVDTKQLQGRQLAALAGMGQLVNTGSALDVVSDTAALGKLDELTIRNNAEREALGFRAQGMNFAAEAGLADARGRNASSQARLGAMTSLFQGVGSVASKWYGFNQAGINVLGDNGAGSGNVSGGWFA